MKAADGVQIAERPEAAIRSAARFALELAGKSKHCEAVADCAHCNLTFLATWAENMLTDLSRAEERSRSLLEALGMADSALSEAEAILGQEYGDEYGGLCEIICELRETITALTAAPEQGKEAKS